MSDLPLPENLADWPADPFGLFGVTPSVSQRDLRRVYTRLIREYKPERFPEHFRRIREAYETLQQYAAWNEVRAESPEGEQLHLPRTTPESIPTPTESVEHGKVIQPPNDTEERCWSLAVAGNPERAYQKLVALQEQKSGQLGIYVKLYWLLLAMPGLDGNRSRREWLVSGLGSCGQFARLLELYGEELADDPSEVLRPPFEKLLDQASGPLLQELIERRWQALSELGRWDVIAADLDALSDRVCRYEEAAWLRLLLSLAAKTVRVELMDIDSVFRSCQARIKNLGHLGLAHSSLFDRAELLSTLAREASAMLPQVVQDVVGHFLAGRTDDAAVVAEKFIARVCENPREGLRLLDQTASSAPFTLLEFGRALDWLVWNTARRDTSSHSEETCDLLVHRLLTEIIGKETYPTERATILNYCCTEAISPEQVCEVLKNPKYAPNYLGPKIAADLPLRWTYRAYHLGWAM